MYACVYVWCAFVLGSAKISIIIWNLHAQKFYIVYLGDQDHLASRDSHVDILAAAKGRRYMCIMRLFSQNMSLYIDSLSLIRGSYVKFDEQLRRCRGVDSLQLYEEFQRLCRKTVWCWSWKADAWVKIIPPFSEFRIEIQSFFQFRFRHYLLIVYYVVQIWIKFFLSSQIGITSYTQRNHGISSAFLLHLGEISK